MPGAVTFRGFADRRLHYLAKRLKLANHYEAWGRMLEVWNHCTERGSHSLPRWLIEDALGPRGPEMLIEAELAELVTQAVIDERAAAFADGLVKQPDVLMLGEYRICGTNGSIEWLERNRSNSSKAGKARAASASRMAGGRYQPGGSQADQPRGSFPVQSEASPSATATATATATVAEGESEREVPPSAAAAKVSRARSLPPDWTPTPKHLERLRSLGQTDAQIRVIVEEFRTFWQSRGKPMKDWNAAFVNQILRLQQLGRLRKDQPKGFEIIRQEQRRLDELEANKTPEQRAEPLKPVHIRLMESFPKSPGNPYGVDPPKPPEPENEERFLLPEPWEETA